MEQVNKKGTRNGMEQNKKGSFKKGKEMKWNGKNEERNRNGTARLRNDSKLCQ